MGAITLPRELTIDRWIDEVDPTCVLYLPLYKLPGEVFYSRDRGWQKATNSGSIWTPKGRFFDGVDDYVNLGASPALDFTTGPFTFIARITPTTMDNSPPIFVRGAAFADHWDAFLSGPGNFNIRTVAAGVVGYAQTTNRSLTPGTPATVAGTRSGATHHAYINGILDDAITTPAVSPASNVGPAYIGIPPLPPFGPTNESLTVHWLAVFSRALSAQEHANIYLATRGAHR